MVIYVGGRGNHWVTNLGLDGGEILDKNVQELFKYSICH